MSWQSFSTPDWTSPDSAKLDAHLWLAAASRSIDHAPAQARQIMVQFEPDHQAELHRLFDGEEACRLTSAHLVNGSAFATAAVSSSMLEKLCHAPWIQRIEWAEPLRAQRPLDRAKRAAAANPTAVPRSGVGSVLLGIVDHGCPFAHRAYRQPGKDGAWSTRILSIWDQDSEPDFPSNLGSPEGFGYGRQARRADLEGFINGAVIGARVDERRCYTLAQYPALDVAYTHGSHTLGLFAASVSPFERGVTAADEGAASTSDIVFVQLPRAVLLAPSHGADHRCIFDGIRYILSCAKKDQRVVVVVDYGSNLGPHNGESLFEKALDNMVDLAEKEGTELQIVFAAGNGYEQKIHGQVKACAMPMTETLDWLVPSGQEVPTFAEVWFSAKDAHCKLEVATPGTDEWHEIYGGDGIPSIQTFGPAASPGFVSVAQKEMSGEIVVAMRVGPTRCSLEGHVPAALGRWRLRFKSSRSIKKSIDVYVCWGGENIGFPKRGGQSCLLGIRSTAVTVSGAGSLIGSACGARVYVSGGYTGGISQSKWDRSPYSAAGPARGGKRAAAGPDWLALSDTNAALKGVLGWGTLGSTVVRIWGTSAAAPTAARIMANHPKLPPSRPRPAEWPKEEYGGGFLK